MSLNIDYYRNLLDKMPQGFATCRVVLDGQGRTGDCIFLEVNPAFESIIGLGREELTGGRWTQVLPEEGDSSLDWMWVCGWVAQTGETASFHKYFASSGWHEVTAYCHQPGHFTLVVQGIDESKTFSPPFRDQAAFFRDLAEHTSDWIWEVDPRGVFTYVNPTVEDLTGYSPQEVLGKTLYDLVIPEESARLKNFFDFVIGRQEAFYLLENTLIHREAYGPVNVEISGVPFFDNKGGLRGYRGIGRDITLRKQAEEALRESEARFRLFAELAPVGIIISDSQERFLYVNQGFIDLFGYTSEELSSAKEWWSLAYPEENLRNRVKKEWKESVAEAVKNNSKVRPLEYPVTCKDGTVRHIEFRAAVTGSLNVVILVDVTERKKNEEKLTDYTLELQELYHQLDQEISKAWMVHQRILPRELPRIPGVGMAAHYMPARKMGGDLFDIVHRGNQLIIYLSDVVGHGLDGAMLSFFVKNAIDIYLSLDSCTPVSPSSIAGFLVRQYQQANYPLDYFICIYIAVLDLDTRELTYVAAGFQDSPLASLGDGRQLELESRGLPVSNAVPLDSLAYSQGRLTLPPGSAILFNTDGLTEQGAAGKAGAPDGQTTGEIYSQRLKKVFFQNTHLPPEKIVHAINQDFLEFNQYSLQGDDDITFIVLKVED